MSLDSGARDNSNSSLCFDPNKNQPLPLPLLPENRTEQNRTKQHNTTQHETNMLIFSFIVAVLISAKQPMLPLANYRPAPGAWSLVMSFLRTEVDHLSVALYDMVAMGTRWAQGHKTIRPQSERKRNRFIFSFIGAVLISAKQPMLPLANYRPVPGAWSLALDFLLTELDHLSVALSDLVAKCTRWARGDQKVLPLYHTYHGATVWSSVVLRVPPSLGMGAPSLHMSAPSLHMGAPSLDMGAPSLDMGAPSLDMGAPSLGMGAPAAVQIKRSLSVMETGVALFDSLAAAVPSPDGTPSQPSRRAPLSRPLLASQLGLCVSFAPLTSPLDILRGPKPALFAD